MSNLLWWEFICLVVPVYALGALAGWSARNAKPPKPESEGGGDFRTASEMKAENGWTGGADER